MIDQAQITSCNGSAFIQAVNSFSAMFQNVETIRDGVAMCITKVDR